MHRIKLFFMTLCLSAMTAPALASTPQAPTDSSTAVDHTVETAEPTTDFELSAPSKICVETSERPVDITDLLDASSSPVETSEIPSESGVAAEQPVEDFEQREHNVVPSNEIPSEIPSETADPLAEQIRLLEVRQQTLEEEIGQLRQQIELRNAQEGDNGEGEVVARSDEEEEDPMGLDVSVAMTTFDPTTGSLDFAIVGSGSAFAIDDNIATVDYSDNQAIRYGGNIRFANSPLDVGFSTISASAEGSASVSAPPGGTLFATLANPSQNERANTASAETNLNYSVTDLEVGYEFDMGSSVNTRLYGGLRFADISQATTARYDGRDFFNGEVSADRSFSGVGLRVGSETELALGSGFSLFGQVGGALMVGDASFDQRETDNDGADEIVSLSRSSKAQLVPMLDLSAGVNWTGDMSEDSRIDFTFGYAAEHWFNVFDGVRSLDSSGSGTILRDSSDLSSHGLFVELGLEFDF